MTVVVAVVDNAVVVEVVVVDVTAVVVVVVIVVATVVGFVDVVMLVFVVFSPGTFNQNFHGTFQGGRGIFEKREIHVGIVQFPQNVPVVYSVGEDNRDV